MGGGFGVEYARPLDVQIPGTPWIFDCSEHKGWFKRADGFCKIEGGKLRIYIGDDLPLTVNTSKLFLTQSSCDACCCLATEAGACDSNAETCRTGAEWQPAVHAEGTLFSRARHGP